MIARLATSPPASEEDHARQLENLQKRFKPALIQQPGLLAAFWLQKSDGGVISLSVWESEELMSAAAKAASATPLLPGFKPEDLPGAHRGQHVEVLHVLDHHLPGGETRG